MTQWYISMWSVILTELTPLKRTKEVLGNWTFYLLPTFARNMPQPCTTDWFTRPSLTLTNRDSPVCSRIKNQPVQNINPPALVPAVDPAIKK